MAAGSTVWVNGVAGAGGEVADHVRHGVGAPFGALPDDARIGQHAPRVVGYACGIHATRSAVDGVFFWTAMLHYTLYRAYFPICALARTT